MRNLTRYFLKIGATGFGGPVALVGFMHRDLVEGRKWFSEDEFQLSVTLAQIMPGPLAAQLAIALGYFRYRTLGATLAGLAFVGPSFFMVVALSILYVAYHGLWWVQALFYGIGSIVIAIIAVAAIRLAKGNNKKDPLLWTIFAALLALTVGFQAELALAFILAGLAVILLRAPPRWLKREAAAPAFLPPWLAAAFPGLDGLTAWVAQHLWVNEFLFFAKASAFVFGSGLAIIPFLHEGVVDQHHWLTEPQFLDAVAVALITPGPVVITVAFIGYIIGYATGGGLATGLLGATVAAFGMFLPVWLFTVVPAPWFQKHRQHPQLKAFAAGATSAATGAMAGAVVILGWRTFQGLPTLAVGPLTLRTLPPVILGLAALPLLWWKKVSEPILVLAGGCVGLALFAVGRVS
ncbi:MAG: chromate efflux transporter [Halobacteriales archaeon]|nr:chromate efflux transporter [Halobacteriales archaeon]